MLKKLVNVCRVKLAIKPQGPLRIGTQGNEIMKMNGRPFIPGSSLKGVFRSHLEKVARTINENAVCNPINVKDTSSCTGRLIAEFEDHNRQNPEDKWKMYPSDLAYKNSCAICKVFGNGSLSSRFKVDDAISEENVPPQEKTIIAIDRFTGGVKHGATATLEVITQGSFETTITLQNFEIWMLGYISILIKDLSQRLIRIGHGTSRGMGKIKASIKEFSILYYVKDVPQNGVIKGIGDFGPSGDYGFVQNDEISINGLTYEPKGYYFQANLSGNNNKEKRQNLYNQTIAKLMEYLQNFNVQGGNQNAV